MHLAPADREPPVLPTTRVMREARTMAQAETIVSDTPHWRGARRARVARGLALIVALGLAVSTAAAQPASAGDTPRFEDTTCPFTAPPEVLARFRCGDLHVPENRAEPNGRRLRLRVAILKSTSRTPRPDPIVFVNGGPGTTTLVRATAFATSPQYAHLLAERDMILYDQRGVGMSEPSICRWLDADMLQLPLRGLSLAMLRDAQRAALSRCAEEMRTEGVDLSQYQSVASALDLRDLRVALGIATWNVYTGSYGSRLTLEALRTAPEGIRAVLMDSPSPPNARFWVDSPQNVASVLDATFMRCARDADCATAVPDVSARFWRNVEALDREPLVLPRRGADGAPDSIVVTGMLLAQAVFQGLYRSEFHAILPLLVREVDRRNRALLANVAQALQAPPGAGSQGLYWAVECHEVAPFNDPSSGVPPRDARATLLAERGFASLGEVCDAFHPFRAGPERAEPVASDVPVLLFSGQLDPVTTPTDARLAAATLSNVRLVALPGAGHGASPRYPCTQRLTRAFFDDPAAPLDVACADSIQPPAFITDVRLTNGVARLASLAAAPSPVLLGSAAASLLVLLTAVPGWPLAALWTRVRRRPRPVRSAFERRAQLTAGIQAALLLLFLAALAWTVVRTARINPYVLALGVPGDAAPLLLVPWVLLVGSVVLMATVLVGWTRRAWTPWGRLHMTLVALANSALVLTVLWAGLV